MRRLGLALALVASATLVACGGGGGGGATAPATPQVTQSLIVLSSNVSANAYPTAYTAATNVVQVDDKCAYGNTQVQYLPVDNKTALPAIQPSATLKGIATLSVSPTDFWINPIPTQVSNPTLDSTCGNMDMRRAFTETLLRAKALGASTVTMYDTRRVDSVSNFAHLTSQFIPDADLTWMATQAQTQSMKLRYKIQIDMVDFWNGTSGGNDINTYLNTLTQPQKAAWLNTLYAQYAIELKHMASVVMAPNASAYDAIEIDWGYFGIPDWTAYNADRYAALIQLSDDIRAINPTWKQWIAASTVAGTGTNMENLQTGAQALVSKVDIIEAMPISTRNTTTNENTSLDVALIKSISGSYLPNWMKVVGKPFMWTLQVQSQNKFFSGTLIDQTCDATLPVDFGAQAVGYEAYLEIIKDWSTGTGVNGVLLQLDSINTTGYAWSDTMYEHTSAYSCATQTQSIRNKPAEAIVYNWFK